MEQRKEIKIEENNSNSYKSKNVSEQTSSNSDEGNSLPLLVLNDLLKVPIRFNIMFLLYTYERLGFTRLQHLLKCSPGNLNHHLIKLIEAGWIADTIVFSPRPLKIFKITPEGKDEFSDYVQHLQKIIKNLR
ncbi:MAG: transcriptional regulator [Promethearchaeota archaeon]